MFFVFCLMDFFYNAAVLLAVKRGFFSFLACLIKVAQNSYDKIYITGDQEHTPTKSSYMAWNKTCYRILVALLYEYVAKYCKLYHNIFLPQQ